ncbi:MAG: hypothetical protein IPO00_17250 [Betaproteobacteria bacterium]|nr:hypothetical protein [Betaproteobacteria bacterium]
MSHWITVRFSIAAFSIGTSPASGLREMMKPPDMLRQVARKADQHSRQASHFGDTRAFRVEACANAGTAHVKLVPLIPPRQRTGEYVDLCRGKRRVRGRHQQRTPQDT